MFLTRKASRSSPVRHYGAVTYFNLRGYRYALRAPWHEPLFSERNNGAFISFLGWRLTRMLQAGGCPKACR